MGAVGIGIAAALLLTLAGFAWTRALQAQRRKFLDGYAFHPAIAKRLRSKRPGLTPEQEALVFRALKDYFHLCAQAGRLRLVAMPSQAVDDAWHEFILFTKAYSAFCRKALGRYLHHTPVEAMAGPTQAQDSIKRAWRLACAKEGIDPKKPARLPLLFALDALLGIPDGFHYRLDCLSQSNGGYCASHIGCAAGCAGDYGGSGSDSCSSDSDGGDCGSSCGGGCGGGGD